jgi:retinol-binding protein 3
LKAGMKMGDPDDNFGFHRVERLPGNIGYIDLVTFNNPGTAGPTAAAAMGLVANCDALIIDLRHNGGGDTDMSTLLSSYFFNERTHLTDIETRISNDHEEVWTLDDVTGSRMPDVPLFVLLSRYSYSTAEAFAYQLQQLGRAVIVGQQTRGGAHSVKYMTEPELGINLKVPYTRDHNPYSGTNYLDGVQPDIATSSEKALCAAGAAAADQLMKSETDVDKLYELLWVLEGYMSELKPARMAAEQLQDYAGAYRDTRISIDCGRMVMTRKGKTYVLLPMGEDQFKYEDPAEAKYRLKFNRDDDGRVTGFHEHDRDGDRYPVVPLLTD